MPNLEWSVPQRFVTPGGTVFLNDPDPATGEIYRVIHDGYSIIPAMRVTQDNISQADGSVLHPRYKTGLVLTLTILYMVTESGTDADPVYVKPACGLQLQTMHQALIQAMNSIKSLSPGVQRYFWQPTGYGDERLLDSIQLLTWPTPTFDLDGVEASVTFSVESPFPYAIDSTEIDTPIAASGTVTVTNIGNAEQSPVVRVFGPSSGFTLTNLDDLDQTGNPLQLVYDSSLPGAVVIPAAHYAEIDFFRGTIFKDGSGVDLIAGISVVDSDFWHLLPGGNDINIIGAGCTVLSNNAWA